MTIYTPNPDVAGPVTLSYATKTDNPEIAWAIKLKEDHGIVYAKLVKLALEKLSQTVITEEELALLKPIPRTGISLTGDTRALIAVKAKAAGMTDEQYVLSLIG